MGTRPSFTLGVEEEFQVIDLGTRALKSHILEMFREGESRLHDAIKREMHHPVIEVGTPICANVAEARAHVTHLRGELIRLGKERGVGIAAAGTHPFSHWKDIPITEAPRYAQIVRDLQLVARANLVFGLHVHIAVEDPEARIAIMNAARYFLPHVFALSVNSPFWCGNNTGWMSYRAKVFERFPRTGLPDYFDSWGEFQEFVNVLIKTGCIDNGKKIWWDLRPHAFFPTLEFRVCDIPMRVDETICMAALFQAITFKLWKLYDGNMGWRIYRTSYINENKQRAARYGLDANLIDFGKQEQVPIAALLDELLAFVDDGLDELGSRKEVYYVREILKRRTGAQRQLDVFDKTKSMPAVVDYIMEETKFGIPV